jgi:O-antigen/teichoic acid export membrane protein
MFTLGFANAFFGKYLYMLIIDEKYYRSYEYIPYISSIMLVMGMGGFVQPILLHFEKLKFYTYANLIAVMAAGILIYVNINKYSLYAVVLSTLFVRILLLIANVTYIKKRGLLLD